MQYIILSLVLSVFQPEWQDVDTIDDFTLVDATSNADFSLSQLRNSAAVVVVFTTLNCPYDKLYVDRIGSLIDQYTKKDVRFILINSSPSSANSSLEMADRIRSLRWNSPYLIDNEQEVANSFGVEKSPTTYVLKPVSQSFQVLYSGSIDDNPQVSSDVTKHYLGMALDAVLQGSPVVIDSTYPTGCMIK